jgi:hypothetical protein
VWLAIAVVAFHACIALGIHLASGGGASAALVARTAPPEPPDPGPDPGEGAAGPSGPVPAAATGSDELERTVSDCVEQIMRAGADAEVEAQAARRGRWPAIKKAREQQRQRRIAARAACEQQGAL